MSLPDTVALESGMPLAYLHTGPSGHVMKKPDRQAAMDKVRAEFLREHMVVNEADGTVRIKPGLVAVIQMGRGEQVGHTTYRPLHTADVGARHGITAGIHCVWTP